VFYNGHVLGLIKPFQTSQDCDCLSPAGEPLLKGVMLMESMGQFTESLPGTTN